MKIEKNAIKYFIPQREPFIMIDNLVDAVPEKFESDFEILPDNIFIEEGKLREFALIENIAQTCAAGLYFVNKDKKQSAPDGYVGGLSKLKLYELPETGQILQTLVMPLYSFANLFLIKGEVYNEGKLLLECEMKLAGI